MHMQTQVEVSEGIYKPASSSPDDAGYPPVPPHDPCYHLPLHRHKEQLP